MIWQTLKQRSPRYRELTLFNAQSLATNWDALPTDLLELWAKLPEIIRQGYEPFPEDNWTRIYFDFWIDSGRIIVFPGPDDVRHASKRPTISVASDLVDGLYHELPDPQADMDRSSEPTQHSKPTTSTRSNPRSHTQPATSPSPAFANGIPSR